ncbi:MULTISPECIES: DoxX family protein [Shewanella]|jgi:putative oxidoreductase|uniref:DoxX family protein n=1 Tax=Shewanella algicola TaxID=640633 RepID=A0A9X1Z775_9GAMM|nr:DoxX family protein [Shewanella algicola]MCL1107631.1 DoxX family protein [Shewanella algicola]GGP70979.1 membrane protein [Shewanella algicola]|tara:strand:+ start:2433 stop:2858 length:426 start_codon:yes stop_codon:yes gene_type:complete
MNIIAPLKRQRLAISALIVGRILLALYFLVPGIMKFVAWDMHVSLMAQHGMVFIPFLLTSAGVFQIVAAFALIFNRYTAIFSLLLAGLVLLININLHDFWNIKGIEGAHELQNFVKNLGIFAGLLLLSGHSYLSGKNNSYI